jgi:hypothetical protein
MMNTRRISTSNTAVVYFLVTVVIVMAFLLLDGVTWIKGMTHTGNSIGMANWNWVHIIVSLGLGFLLGLIVAKRKW